jgi:uncharacterized protein (TIGR00725 family)
LILVEKYKYKLGVSGAEVVDHCHEDAAKRAREIGRQIAKHGGAVITGACWGMPNEAVIGAKEVGGFTIGVSPAISEKKHKEDYQFPTENYDFIFYTGYGFSARDVWLMRMSDAVIFICGRIGTLNEFTICFEDNNLMGVLEGTGGTADMIKNIIKKAHKGPGWIIYEKDPKKLVDKICQEIDKERNLGHSKGRINYKRSY